MADVNLANPTAPSIWETTVKDRLQLLNQALEEDAEINAQLPGLKEVLANSLHNDQDEERFFRDLLKVFENSDLPAYEEALSDFPEAEQGRVSKFVKGTPLNDLPDIEELVDDGVFGLDEDDSQDSRRKNSFWKLEPFVRDLRHFLREMGGQNSDVQIHKNEHFQNWGKVPKVDYTPNYTCVPSTVIGVQCIIKAARKHKWGIRCSGYRHSWAPLFGRSGSAGQVLISLLPIKHVTRLPNFLPLGWLPPMNELRQITVVGDGPNGNGKTLIRVGAGVTNEALRRRCLEEKLYTLPLNVIMVEITVGGANAPICHGAGIRNQTLSDLVRKIEYVDCNGNHQTVDQEADLRAAAGCFGLIGVITHLTLEFDPMSHTEMKPVKLAVIRAVPPPDDMPETDIPEALRLPVTPEQRKEDIERFEKHCEDDYAEWFWFPYHDEVWVNCWNKAEEAVDATSYPGPFKAGLQIIEQFGVNWVQTTRVLERLFQRPKVTGGLITVLSKMAMASLPAPKEPIKTYLPEALHFQRGIQNLRVLDLEVEIPIPEKKGTKGVRDLHVVRRAWWDAILECYRCYEENQTTPQQMPLEMRIMGDSNIIMAPQRGNTLGTCSIEILTLYAAREAWIPYAQKVLDKWMCYKDSNGKPLATRPHWAKQWVEFTVNGEPWREKLLRDYEEQIKEFKDQLTKLGEKHGWNLDDLKECFSNDTLDDIFFPKIDQE